jgi:hypothetical protein
LTRQARLKSEPTEATSETTETKQQPTGEGTNRPPTGQDQYDNSYSHGEKLNCTARATRRQRDLPAGRVEVYLWLGATEGQHHG